MGATQIHLSSKEQRAIRKATEWRDAIVHHEFELPEYQVESVYTQLFEFISSFHNDHTTFGELHRYIDPSLWDAEARLIDSFRNDFVIYNGVEVPRWWPTEVMKWQTATLMELHGKQCEALPYGVEPGWEVNADLIPCHDCGVVKGMFHIWRDATWRRALGASASSSPAGAFGMKVLLKARSDRSRSWSRKRGDGPSACDTHNRSNE